VGEVSSVAQNLAAIRKQLSPSVTVLGVTKKQPLENVQAAVDAGLQDLGNNYAQEGEALKALLGEARDLTAKSRAPLPTWHFIGHIQSRKVKYLVHYDWVHSLDRIEIVAELNKRLEAENRTIYGLIEVNIGEEDSKSGILPADVDAFAQSMMAFARIRCRGIMVMPPPLETVEDRRPFFQRARAIVQKHNAAGWDTLSMGTSEDYLLAVEEGATIVRLGTVLFGARA
jgi:pyridoxal phosphate enzyme (YggS family)